MYSLVAILIFLEVIIKVQYSNIYVFTNVYNNKKYVGQSINPSARYHQHFKDAKNRDYLFYRAIRKYGKYGFTFEIIEENIPLINIHERERFWIKHLNSKKPFGYNLTDGGEGTFGYNHTDEAKLKMSMNSSHKGTWIRSDEHKQQMSERSKNRIISNETRNKIAKSRKGKLLSEETKEKISKILKGRIFTEEHKINMANAKKNIPLEKKIEKYKKAVETKKKNGVDYAKHFREMNDDEKVAMYQKISKSNPRNKPVRCLTMDGVFYMEFHSVGNAGKWVEKTQKLKSNPKKNIMSSINRNGTAYGYKWEYIESQTTIS
jgi:group I intron endonuclease